MSETNELNALLDRYLQAEGETLLVMSANSARPLTASEVALGFNFLSKLAKIAEALELTLDAQSETPELTKNPQSLVNRDFSYWLHELNVGRAQQFLTRLEGGENVFEDPVELIDIGIINPFWAETRNKRAAKNQHIRKFLAVVSLVGTLLTSTATVGESYIDNNSKVAIERIHSNDEADKRLQDMVTTINNDLRDVLRDPKVPVHVKDRAQEDAFREIERLTSQFHGLSVAVLPADSVCRQHLGIPGAGNRPAG
jgi:hypothetical protein